MGKSMYHTTLMGKPKAEVAQIYAGVLLSQPKCVVSWARCTIQISVHSVEDGKQVGRIILSQKKHCMSLQ